MESHARPAPSVRRKDRSFPTRWQRDLEVRVSRTQVFFQPATVSRFQYPIWTMKRSDDSHRSRGFSSEHSRSSEARHRLNHAQKSTEFSTEFSPVETRKWRVRRRQAHGGALRHHSRSGIRVVRRRRLPGGSAAASQYLVFRTKHLGLVSFGSDRCFRYLVVMERVLKTATVTRAHNVRALNAVLVRGRLDHTLKIQRGIHRKSISCSFVGGRSGSRRAK